MPNPFTIAIVGNPNVGKTTLFNALTGLTQRTGNYPGVTVVHTVGSATLADTSAAVVDLPGAYSLAARSPDEAVVVDVLLGLQPGQEQIDVALVVVDATNIERSLYLVSQVRELPIPMAIALTMVDAAESKGICIDCRRLADLIGVPVVPVRARQRGGIEELKEALVQLSGGHQKAFCDGPTFPANFTREVEDLADELGRHADALGRSVSRVEAFRGLVDSAGHIERRWLRDLDGHGRHGRHGRRHGHSADVHVPLCHERHGQKGRRDTEHHLNGPFRERLAERRRRAAAGSLPAVEARCRYAWVHRVAADVVTGTDGHEKKTTDRLDNVLTHPLVGTLVFVIVMAALFQAVYSGATPAMFVISHGFDHLSHWIVRTLPSGVLRSLLVDGIVAGVGAVMAFLPQVLLLTLLIALLEDCGYMARAAFLMDKPLSGCGLSGQSFLPLLSSFACAVPGIMATRTIGNPKDRLATMLVAPLMSCSARLPVYTIMIAAFVPNTTILGGFFGLQGVVLLGLYGLGIVLAFPVAWVLKRTVLKGEAPPFLLEMPGYKIPHLRSVAVRVWVQGREFLLRAGTIIFAITGITWALGYFPHADAIARQYDAKRIEVAAAHVPGTGLDTALEAVDREENGAHLSNSYLGRMGRAIEPVVAPLGWDWRIGMAAIASFPAREVVVAALASIFNLGNSDEISRQGFVESLRHATRPDGRPLFNLPVALSILVFFALCCQCGATLAMLRRETGSWRLPMLAFAYMTVLAYFGAFVTYQTAAHFMGIL